MELEIRDSEFRVSRDNFLICESGCRLARGSRRHVSGIRLPGHHFRILWRHYPGVSASRTALGCRRCDGHFVAAVLAFNRIGATPIPRNAKDFDEPRQFGLLYRSIDDLQPLRDATRCARRLPRRVLISR